MCYFRAFRSCGEGEVLDAGGVVAGQVVLVAVPVLVVPHVVVEVAVDDDGAELEDVLGAYQLEISAFGYNSGDPAIERIYPWYGFRVGVIGTP